MDRRRAEAAERPGGAPGLPRLSDAAEIRDPRIRKAVHYIRLHHASPDLGLETVAAYVDLSRFHFSRIFRENAGLTFSEYVTRVRMRHAAEILSERDAQSITRAAFDLGYALRTFELTFKKTFGITPQEWRERHGP